MYLYHKGDFESMEGQMRVTLQKIVLQWLL